MKQICKVCTLEKPKIYEKLNTQGRCYYVDGDGPWHGKTCSLCFSKAMTRRKQEIRAARQLKKVNEKLIKNLRKRLSKVVKRMFTKKAGSAIRDLGCSADQLRIHLESQFKSDMTWHNYGIIWEIDHIYPLSKANLENREELLKVVHYSNLQPLYCFDNRSKGNKILA